MHTTPNKRKNNSYDAGGSPKKKTKYSEVQRRPRSHSIDSASNSESSSKETSFSDVSDSGRAGRAITRNVSFSWTPRSRRRSYSIDSVPESVLSSRSSKFRQTLEGVVISANAPPPEPVYHPFRGEVEETHNLHVPGEIISGRGLPVRFLDYFTMYDESGTYLPFAYVAASILSATTREIRASGIVSRCLEDDEDGDSDIAEEESQLLVSLQPLKDFWTDYGARQPDGVWGERVVAVATSHGWYILQRPAPLYTSHYQPFWLSHHLTWIIAKAIREDIGITFNDFCDKLEYEKDNEAVSIMGRQLVKRDVTRDYVTLYIQEQLAFKKSVADYKMLLKSPLLQNINHRASSFGLSMEQFLDVKGCNGPMLNSSGKTVTMPLVHDLTTGLFLKTLLKAGKTLDNLARQHELLQIPKTPDKLHPDHPTNIEWERPVTGFPKYFSEVSLDGETYKVGDVVMVSPGEDDLIHRAQSALEACSQSRNNELVNTVWFCQIVYMFDKPASSKKHESEPTAHVRWYQHGSRTILQETAHPYALFALAECANIPLGSILGPCPIRHLKPGEEEPHDYHCSFLWDANEARFLDQSILKHANNHDPPSQCPCCIFNEKRDQHTMDEVLVHSVTYAAVRGIEYHANDFVYIAANPKQPYLIGQIRRFIVDGDLTLDNSKVEVTQLGRYDDIARVVDSPDILQDETRLFMTDQVDRFSLPLLEGKCFVVKKNILTSQDVPNYFYVDRWAARPDIRGLNDLKPFAGRELAVCKTCVHAAEQERDAMHAYKTSKTPLRTMELFAGAGGLSTGLEQSGFVKTHWAVEILPGAAATFKANHPHTIVYNQDTNVCLQNAIDAREGKTCTPLMSISNRELPPMPQRGDVDLITGGFPCQSFSGMNHQRHKRPDDIRTTLVANMLSYVEFYEPRYVLMENVKGLLQYHSGGAALESTDDDDDNGNGDKVIKMSIVKFVLRALLRLGYQTQFRVLQAADYGSPQRRERVIFWAARRSEPLPEYPLPTHVTPHTKSEALTLPTRDKLYPVQHSEKNCAPLRALVVADAISDLPGFDWKNPHSVCSETTAEAEEKLGRREHYRVRSAVSTALRTLAGFAEPVEYATLPSTRYQRMLRGENDVVTLHCSRTFSAPVVERVWHACGDNVTGPSDLPRQLWPPALLKVSKDKAKLRRKWQVQFGRLKWKEPFNTALTSCRPFSKGSKVLHPEQKRIITARECARSQGFPDSYEFVQTDKDGGPAAWVKLLDDIHKQIGNAVPIPLAHALGKSLGKALVARWLEGSASKRESESHRE